MTGVVMLLFVLFPEILYRVSEALQLHHLTTMLMVTFLFLLAIVLHYSTALSTMSERETELAQQVALLTWQMEQLAQSERASSAPAADDAPSAGNSGDREVGPGAP